MAIEPNTTTVGQLLINSALPESMRDYSRVFDKKSMASFLTELQTKVTPDQFRDTVQRLSLIGLRSVRQTPGASFSINDLKPTKAKQRIADEVRRKIREIIRSEKDPNARNDKIVDIVQSYSSKMSDQAYEEALSNSNPFALQVLSGSRGNKSQLNTLIGSDLLYADYRDRPIPIPILNSYSEGVDPVEYFAGSYGARKGTICLQEDTEVLMSDFSTKKIKDINIGDIVMGSDLVGNMKPTKVVDKFNNGLQPCYEYTFRKNSCRNNFVNVICTEEHKFLATIKAGHGVYKHHSTYTSTLLPLKKARLNTNPNKNWFVATPSQGYKNTSGIHEPMALLIGLMIGDGCMAKSTGGRYLFSCADELLIEDTKEYLSTFGISFEKAKGDNYNYKIAGDRQTSVALAEKCGEKLAHEKTLPVDVFEWDDTSISWLLSGLLATDGSIWKRSRGISISYASTSKVLIEQLIKLLELRCGIWCSEIEFVPKHRKQWAINDLYILHINHKRSIEKLFELVHIVGVKGRKLEELLSQSNTYHNNKEHGFKIQSRTLLGNLQTYDIEVDNDSHAFVLANGMVSSNSTKFSTAEAGFAAKQLNLAAHRLLVSDDDPDPDTVLPIESDDPDNIGAVIARDYGAYKAGTVITPRIAKDLANSQDKILIYSPLTSIGSMGRIPRLAAGIREKGELAKLGDNIGMTAAQSISEPLSQMQLSTKHGGGVAKAKGAKEKTITGFDYIEQLMQVPKSFKSGAAMSSVDGYVTKIEPAPQGGTYIHVGPEAFYAPPDQEITVKTGQLVEAGDSLSDGIVNPSEIVTHKGIGEGRRTFMKQLHKAFRDNGIQAHRRNVEVVSRALINHVKLNDENVLEGHLPDDVVSYDYLASKYQPRANHQQLNPNKAVGMYLERPALHYSIGTRITPRVAKEMDEFGFKNVFAHKDPPKFEPMMVRAMDSLMNDPDWITQLGGFHLKRNFLNNIFSGGKSWVHGTSFIPPLASGEIGKGPKGLY